MALQRKPEWLKKKMDPAAIAEMEGMLRSLNLHTVCEGANCPNRGECFKNRTATFMILGDVCTRNCRFCAVCKGRPAPVDPMEPDNIATAAQQLGLRHIVITSVTRDDLPDGGAAHFAECIRALKERMPDSTVEVLIPDFRGSLEALQTVMAALPEIINHNIETVPRLYPAVRPMAQYERSLELLERVKRLGGGIYSKTGIMVGLGETEDEVLAVMDDLIAVGCDILTIGQYLQPSREHIAIAEFVHPDRFEKFRRIGLEKGFKYVASGPFVRSSYNAIEGMKEMMKRP
ncbi:MAG: lipoyl synthase [Christensenellaceae bacterium]|nr:lipoyl synthase [Christensenellaceae bacterium]